MSSDQENETMSSDQQTNGNEGSGLSKTLEKKIRRKQIRFQHMIKNDTGIDCFDTPKKNLIVCNAGLTTGLDHAKLVKYLGGIGKIRDVRMLPGKSYCFVLCSRPAHAERIYQAAHAKCPLGQNDSPIYLTYCETVPERDESKSINFNVPYGVDIFYNFLTRSEEKRLLELMKWDDENTPADSMLKHRQVKHFGYKFRYDTNDVDVNQPLVDEKIPSECDFIWDKEVDKQSGVKRLADDPHQLTVNKYEPGQGIPPHCDTHGIFTSMIMSVSLGSDVVMEFRKPHPTNEKEYTDHRYVYLPRRSLMLLHNEARYGWKHSITPRKIDIVPRANGSLTAQYRKTRVSYTFRWLSDKPCVCNFPMLCDTFKAAKAKEEEKARADSIADPSKCELENVHQVYNEIANHFSETRHSPWPKVTNFLERFDIGSVLVDVGCGNGKYLYPQSGTFKIGCDRSDGLLNVCRERSFNVFQCDCLAVPIKSESVDGCYSIAVIHHLASEERRVHAIKEMIRILRVNGSALIYVWAKNQAFKNKSKYLKQNKHNDDEFNTVPTQSTDTETQSTDTETTSGDNLSLPIHTNRTQFMHSDVLVPWKLKQSTPASDETAEAAAPADNPAKTFLRYYHVFDENELFALCSQFDNISIEESYYDQGNWCIIFRKIAN